MSRRRDMLCTSTRTSGSSTSSSTRRPTTRTRPRRCPSPATTRPAPTATRKAQPTSGTTCPRRTRPATARGTRPGERPPRPRRPRPRPKHPVCHLLRRNLRKILRLESCICPTAVSSLCRFLSLYIWISVPRSPHFSMRLFLPFPNFPLFPPFYSTLGQYRATLSCWESGLPSSPHLSLPFSV